MHLFCTSIDEKYGGLNHTSVNCDLVRDDDASDEKFFSLNYGVFPKFVEVCDNDNNKLASDESEGEFFILYF